MKKLLIAIFIVAFFFHQPIAAVTPASASATPTNNPDTSRQIEQLKERLATKVAELRQLEKRAVAGIVKSTSIASITITTQTKDVKVELPDEVKIVQILKGVRTTLTIDDVSKGDEVVIFGDFDVTLDLLKAKTIFIAGPLPVRIHGKITDTDTDAFTLTIETPDKISYIVDFERTTKANTWSKDKGMEKAGFSKLLVGDRVHIAGTLVPKKENRLSALRILDIGKEASSSAATAQ